MHIVDTHLLTNLLSETHHLQTFGHNLLSGMTWLGTITEKDVDIFSQVQQAFQHFVKTGQIWALLIGLFVGYLFKGFTSY